ncbi:nuclear protein 96-domain-containing protein [Flagelloscypha sp. PMI_526]|nr:nuclear protein 96-domain-containing protein [Flagelloscypha sp. PMI_526]
MARFKAYISDDDSGDEDQHMDIQKPVSTKEPARKAASPASSVSSEASTEAPSSPEDDTDSLMHEDELLNFPSQGTVLPPTMNRNMAGLDGGRMNAMQASLFHGRPPPPSRKHPRPSESELGTSWEDRDAPIARDSFAQPVVNGTKPGRKYMRGGVTSSAQVLVQDVLETPQLQLPIPVPSSESSYQKYGSVSHLVADAALSQGCSFRASWGPGGLLAIPSTSLSGPSIIRIHELPHYSEDEAVVRDTFLPHLLAHAPIQLDEDSIPFVNPEGGSTSLSFSAFAALLPAPTQQIVPGNWLRELFKASSALFDPLPLSSRTSPLQEQLARKKLFSRFLQSSLNPHGTAHSSASPIDSIFRHLSLHQLERAADAAIASGYPRLALLIAHGGSTTPEFRHEMKEQLRIWRDESISNSYIEPGVRRCYALLSGDTDELLAEGVFAELKGAGGGWKRIFSVLMWFVLPLSASLADIYHAYVSLLNEDFLGLPKPLPPYASMTPDGSSDYTDPIFLLLQLYSVPATSLNSVLDPRNFSPNPLNVGLPWLLGILLNRVWDIRDFEDREKLDTRPPIDMNDETAELPEESADVELGHSPSSDLLTNSYVAALEARQDSLQESIFVALFGEAGVGRKHVVTGLLERSGWQLGDEWLLRGLIGSLKLGQGGFGGMVEAAKGCWAFGQGMMWEAYVFWLDAARRGKLPSGQMSSPVYDLLILLPSPTSHQTLFW